MPKECDQEFVKSINFGNNLPTDFLTIAKEINHDKFLQSIISFMSHGWPKSIDKQFVNVYANQQDLEIIDECLLFQDRVVIPEKMQDEILKLLHGNHAGVVKMKRLARRTVYWFGINTHIEKFVADCDVCTSMAIVPKHNITSKWTATIRPVSRIHIYFFHFEHRTFLLIVDSFSKWLEVEWMRKGTNASEVLTKLIEYFARFGLPDVLVSDNGPPFNSHLFKSFLKRQGIEVLNTPPYNPASNGQAERLVRTTKDVLKKFLVEPGMLELNLEDQINLFLINYRNGNMTSDGSFPSEKVFTYTPKMLIDLINPKKHYKQMLVSRSRNDDEKSDGHVIHQPDPLDALMPGDIVWYKQNIPYIREKWIKASFLKRFSKNLLQISVGNEATTTVHPTQIRILEAGDRSSGQPRPSMRGIETSRSMPTGVQSEISIREQDNVWPIPDRDENQPKKIIESRNRKRKFPSNQVELDGLPRRSKRARKPRVDNEFEYF